MCTGARTQAGSRGIKSHCVRSQSTERRIKDLRDVIWLIWGVLRAFGGTAITAAGDWHCWSVSHIRVDHSTGEQTNRTHEVQTHEWRPSFHRIYPNGNIYALSSPRIANNNSNKEVWFMYAHSSAEDQSMSSAVWKHTFMASDVHKYKIPLPAVDKTVIPLPRRAGSKISN